MQNLVCLVPSAWNLEPCTDLSLEEYYGPYR